VRDFLLYCLRELRRIGGFLIGLVGFVMVAGGIYGQMWLSAGLGVLVLILAVWMMRYDD
jgi:hypothetical protein